MQSRFILYVLLAVALGSSACTSAKISGRGAYPILLNSPNQKVVLVKHIEKSKMIVFDYTNAFDVSEVLGDTFEKYNADAIANVTITIKSNIGTFFVNLFTLCIADAKSVHISGDLVNEK